jgi:hypothetical protein
VKWCLKAAASVEANFYWKQLYFTWHFKHILITVDSNIKDFITNDYYFTYLVIWNIKLARFLTQYSIIIPILCLHTVYTRHILSTWSLSVRSWNNVPKVPDHGDRQSWLPCNFLPIIDWWSVAISSPGLLKNLTGSRCNRPFAVALKSA